MNIDIRTMLTVMRKELRDFQRDRQVQPPVIERAAGNHPLNP